MVCATLSFQREDSALYWAARHGHLDVVQFLCEKRAIINSQDRVCANLCPDLKKYPLAVGGIQCIRYEHILCINCPVLEFHCVAK